MPKPAIVLRPLTQWDRQELLLMKTCGTPFEVLRASFILGLDAERPAATFEAGKFFGFCHKTSAKLAQRFNRDGPDACRYQFNELASIARTKLSFEAQERAIALAKAEALTLVALMEKLRAEGLVGNSETVGAWALTAALRRGGVSCQRTRYSLKKNETPSSSRKPSLKFKN